jgi:hypothetical protein
MKARGLLLFFIGVGCVAASAPALALYKCTTKTGVTYQDKPCMEAASNDVITLASRDPRQSVDRVPVRGHQQIEPERPKSIADQRRLEEMADAEEWQMRAARKADSVRSCATRETRCNASALRVAAMYLSEQQLETALGSPAEKNLLGMERSSIWTVRVNDSGRLQNVKLVAAWGLCSDDRNFFATGLGQRACKVSVD